MMFFRYDSDRPPMLGMVGPTETPFRPWQAVAAARQGFNFGVVSVRGANGQADDGQQ
jgi:hypothetical protein